MIPQRVPRMTRSLLVRHQLRSAFQSSASRAAALTSQESNTAGAGRGRNINASVNASKLKLCPRSENFSEWYADVLSTSDMIDSSPVRGCMIIKPWGMAVWERIRDSLDISIKKSGAQNAYFPLFIPLSYISKEAEHVDGFAKECAVVTHHRLCSDPAGGGGVIPDSSAKLEEPLVVRPTSETIIWSSFSNWIQSYRDLPMKINQWANVVRWEMRPRPFLRTSEFLWQEGHTAHATAEDALQTTHEMLKIYESLCKDLLAIPVIAGEKSISERFAGAESTYSIEAAMQNGWALQCGTSHYLGQNFSKAFNVRYNSDENEGKEFAFGTSWGVSTRLIGALIMTHSDDIGLVLPPNVAPIQVILIPIAKVLPANKKAADPNNVSHHNIIDKDRELTVVRNLQSALESAGIRSSIASRREETLGALRFHWERKGVPLRIEIGPKDIDSNSVVMAIRHNGKKISVPLFLAEGSSSSPMDSLVDRIRAVLSEIQTDMLAAAAIRQQEMIVKVSSYSEMKELLDKTKQQDDLEISQGQNSTGPDNKSWKTSLFLAPWCEDTDNEAFIKTDCKATIRCYPSNLNASPPPPGVKCFYSEKQATHMALFGRAF